MRRDKSGLHSICLIGGVVASGILAGCVSEPARQSAPVPKRLALSAGEVVDFAAYISDNEAR
jgi:hypothetical protein